MSLWEVLGLLFVGFAVGTAFGYVMKDGKEGPR